MEPNHARTSPLSLRSAALAFVLAAVCSSPEAGATPPSHEPLPIRHVDIDAAAWPVPDGELHLAATPQAATSGLTGSGNWANAIVLDMEVRRLVGGQFGLSSNGLTHRNLIRIRSDGSIDDDYSSGVKTTDGSILAIWRTSGSTETYFGGSFTQVEGFSELARLFRANDSWYPFSPRYVDEDYTPAPNGLVNFIADEAISGRATYLVGGAFTATANGQFLRGAGRLTQAGAVAQSLDLAAIEIRSLVRYPDGRFLIGGNFSITGIQRNLMRYTATTSVDGTFQTATSGNGNRVNAMLVQPDGKILIAGSFSQVNGTARANVARLNADGSLDASFNAATNDAVYSAVLLENGNVLLGGNFTSVNGATAQHFAYVSSTGALLQTFAFNDNIYGLNADALGNVHIAGAFTSPQTLIAMASFGYSETPGATYSRLDDTVTVNIARGGTMAVPEQLRLLWKDSAGNVYASADAQRSGSGNWTATMAAPQQSGTFVLVPEYHLRGGLGNNSMSVTTPGWSVPLTRHRVRHELPPVSFGTGTVTQDVGPYVNDGESVVFTLTPASNSYIQSVTGCGGTLSGNQYTTAPITDDCVVHVEFGGRSIGSMVVDNLGTSWPLLTLPVDNQTDISFTYTLNGGYELDHIEAVGNPSASHCEFRDVTASGFIGKLLDATSCTFNIHARLRTYQVTPAATGQGTISPSVPVTVTHGDSTQFTVAAAQGWQLDGVSGCNGALAGSTYVTGPITDDCTVSATFSMIALPVALDASPTPAWPAYGQPFDYVVSLRNDAAIAASGIHIQSNLPDAADPQSLVWECMEEGAAGHTCGSGQGALDDAGVAMPTGATLHWLIQGIVQSFTPLPELELELQVSAPWLATPLVRILHTPIVLFRDDFDAPDEDPGVHDAAER